MQTKGYIERAILRVIDQRNGPPGTKDIIQQMRRVTASTDPEASSVRRALARLQDKGLIREKTPDRFDEPPRQKYWWWTEAGYEEAERLRAEYKGEFKALQKRFGGRW